MRTSPSFAEGSVTASQETRSAPSLMASLRERASGNLWGIILAGGHGRRVRRFMRRLNGSDVPKPFSAVIGRRSMLQHTVNRAATCIAPDRITTLIIREHLARALEQLGGQPSEHLIVQPSNRDTAPAILLGLLSIQVRDPEATVAIFPSDHFIAEEEIFMDHVMQGVQFLAEHPQMLILLGIAPDRPETAYGWIDPGEEVTRQAAFRLLQVRGFREKPDPATAERLYLEGGLWNSLGLLGRLSSFLQAIQQRLPDLWKRFGPLRAALGTSRAIQIIEKVYREMPAVNISRHLLEWIPDRLGVIPVKGVLWSDWGEEERIFEALRRIGKADELVSRLRASY